MKLPRQPLLLLHRRKLVPKCRPLSQQSLLPRVLQRCLLVHCYWTKAPSTRPSHCQKTLSSPCTPDLEQASRPCGEPTHGQESISNLIALHSHRQRMMYPWSEPSSECIENLVSGCDILVRTVRLFSSKVSVATSAGTNDASIVIVNRKSFPSILTTVPRRSILIISSLQAQENASTTRPRSDAISRCQNRVL